MFGNPVAISVAPGGNTTLNLGTAAGQISLSANGGGHGGNGGTITVSSGVVNIQTAQAVQANAAVGFTGNGGWIYIPSFIDIIQDNASSITALGHGTGNGGQFFGFPTTSQTVNVNKWIKVDGDVAQIGNTTFDGKITLDTVACQQWKTGFAGSAWPMTYWNCIDGNRATGMPVATAANSLEAGLRSLLGQTKSPDNPSVQIYVMSIVDAYGNYFGVALPSNHSGIYGLSTNTIRVSAAFANVYDPNSNQIAATAPYPPATAGSPTIMQASIVHELGHELDYIWGNLSTVEPFLTDRTNDLTKLLNSGACTNAFTAASCAVAKIANLPDNLQRYGSAGFGYSTSNIELFPIVFAHLEGVAHGYAGPPDLEMAVGTQFTDMGAYIQGLINNPPPPVN